MIISESEIRSMIRRSIIESRDELSEKMGKVGFSLKGRASKQKIAKSDRLRSKTAVGFNKNAVSKSKTDKSGINSGVKTNTKIVSAWQWLRPWLPHGAKLTSGERTQNDQDRIIRNYAKKSRNKIKEIPSADLDAAHKELKGLGFIILRFITRGGHGGGAAFDVSGADLDEIASAVEAVSENDNIPVKLAALIERKNIAVHVTIKRVDEYDPSTYEATS